MIIVETNILKAMLRVLCSCCQRGSVLQTFGGLQHRIEMLPQWSQQATTPLLRGHLCIVPPLQEGI